MLFAQELAAIFKPVDITWSLEYESINGLWRLMTQPNKDVSSASLDMIIGEAKRIAAEEQKHLDDMRAAILPPKTSAMEAALRTSHTSRSHNEVGTLFIVELDALIAKFFTLVDPTPKLKVASLATYKEDGAVLVVIDAFEAKVKAR